MKKLSTLAFALMMMGTSTVMAQSLTLKKKYVGNWQNESVSSVNKPNGNMYRLREEHQADDLPLIPRIENADSPKIVIISERIESGWMALYRNPLGAASYDFIVVFYDKDKNPTASIDLCQVSNTYNCEVQDIRWDAENGDLLFNMACPSYASSIGGKGSKLFSYNVESEKMNWSTPYLTSNDIFIFNKDYVFCAYGFTNEKDYIFMLDKKTGKIFSKLPTAKSIDYMELQQKNGQEMLYAVDYNGSLYVYNINKTTVKKPVAKKPAAKKPAARK